MKKTFIKTLCSCACLASAPSLANEYPSIEFSGNVMLDYDYFEANFLESPETDQSQRELEVRRFRLRAESDLSADWYAKLSLDASEGSEIKDAYIKYDGWELADITVGRQREPFGLERLMSSKNTLMIERSIVSNIIAPGRSYGLKASGKKKSINWQLGYFQDDNSQRSNAITGRLAWRPWKEDKNFVHIGASFSERNLKGDVFRVNEALEVNGADSLVEGRRFDADSASLVGAEWLWQQDGFVSMAEWQQSKVKAEDGTEYLYQGGYMQFSYLFSGKNRKYKNGVLRSVKTENDWEITTRYSQLTLDEENREAKVFSAGVNYYLNKDLKLMADYLNAEYIDDGTSSGASDAISFRVQYKF